MRAPLVAGYAVLLLVLVLASSPRRAGDGAEYMAMADNLHRLRAPALTREDLDELKGRFAEIGSGYDAASHAAMNQPRLRSGGRQDFLHFWFYPLLVAPWMWLTDAVGANPGWAFTLANALFLLVAAAVVASRLSLPAAALLFAGPIVWWVDKPHTEPFVFSFLAMGFALLRDRPWWSLPCFGAAATQYTPIAFVIPLAALAVVLERRELLRDRRLWAGAAAGLALAAIHPVYYLLRLGVTSSTLRGTVDGHVPSLTELRVPLLDLNAGLVPSFPPFVVAVIAVAVILLARRPRALLRPTILLTVAVAGFLLASVSQVGNTNAGGTPGMSRYALWFIPLAIPLLQEAEVVARRRLALWVAPAAVVSLVWAVVSFDPAQEENYLRPSWAARQVWAHAPSWENPMVAIFYERTSGEEAAAAPVGTPSCSKVLVVAGRWPRDCPKPSGPLRRCLTRYCYANRSGSGYTLAEAPAPYTRSSPSR